MSNVIKKLYKLKKHRFHFHNVPINLAIKFYNSLRRVLPDLPEPRITLTQSITFLWFILDKTDGKKTYFYVGIRLHPERDCYMVYLPTKDQFYEIELDYNSPDTQELMSEFESKHFVYDS